MMVEFMLRVLGLLEEFVEFVGETVRLSKVKRSEICEKRLIDEVIIDVEEECIGLVLGRVLVGKPVETFGNDFDSTEEWSRIACVHGDSENGDLFL